MTDWHLIHLGHLALSGAALLTIEATAVVPEGRISLRRCRPLVGRMRGRDAARPGERPPLVRHADRDSARAMPGERRRREVPWKGGGQIPPGDRRGWQTVAPSALPFAAGENPPLALDRPGLMRVRDASPMRPGAPPGSASMPFSSTGRTAICCTSSSRPCRTGVTDEYGG